MASFIDITGQRFGRWTVLYQAPYVAHRHTRWVCRCDCGTDRSVDGVTLRNGHSQSCGCLFRELSAKCDDHDHRKIHGDIKGRKPHLYVVWGNMKGRCNNPGPSQKYYKDKNISYALEWADYTVFKAWALANGYTEGLSLDRKDPDKNYCPENCQWLTKSENSRKTMLENHAKYIIRRRKLTEVQVLEIKRSNALQKVLATNYGVTPAAISSIKRGRSWRWVI